MKKILFLCCMMFAVHFTNAQGNYIQSRINKIPAADFIPQNIFNLKNATSENIDFNQYVSEYTLADVSNTALTAIVEQDDYAIEVDVPYNGTLITLQLMRSPVITPNTKYTVQDGSGKHTSHYKPGAHYMGVVKNIPGSWVGISFFDNDIIATIATPGGNIVIGKSNIFHQAGEEYIIYNDKFLKIENTNACGVSEDMHKPIPDYTPQKATRTVTTNCVKFYVECDFKVYQDFGNDTAAANNFATGLFNIVGVLYLNDSVSTSVNQINLWTVADPYVGATTTSQALTAFATQMSGGFNGDLAHLLSRRTLGGGIAYLNVFCDPAQYRTGVSANLSTGLTPLPTYSWNSMVVTHETGHNMGSPHTHACAWNGNGTRIDNCAGNYNVAYQEGTCNSFPPNPPGGGTIMSYCHLQNGINLSFGFGPQPGTLIRANVNTGPCLTICEDCNFDIVIGGVFSDPLTESTTWIKSSGQTTILSTAQVKLDPEPYNGYALMMPLSNSDFFESAPANNSSFFVAQAYDGCSGFEPLKPTSQNEEEGNELIQSDEFTLFPNPSYETIYIRNNALNDELLSYQILSTDGKLIAAGQDILFNKIHTVDLRQLSAGLYFMKIINKHSISTLKFQKY